MPFLKKIIRFFREDRIRNGIESLYLNILGREADAEGLYLYTGKILAGELTLAGLETILKESPEYLNRNLPETPKLLLQEESAGKRRINLGCGHDRRPDYLNVDIKMEHTPDLIADVRRLQMLPDEYFDEILALDLLEHQERTETGDVLAEWNRILKIGGVLKVQVPSVIGIADLLMKPENQSIEMQKQLIQNLFGTQAYRRDFHYTSFTHLLLKDYLVSAGFNVMEITVKDGWLFQVIAKKVAGSG